MESNTLTYKVTSIFYSIQGEGYYTGKPAIFIHFEGCNLSCSFCDEPQHKYSGRVYTDEEIIQTLEQYLPCRFVVLTGGEPTIQTYFSELVEILQQKNYFVAIETNGTTHFRCLPDWITVSPKQKSFIIGDELKIIYDGQELIQYEKYSFKHFYVQPLNDENDINWDSVKECIEVVKKNPLWKLSLQVHKILRIN